MSAAELFSDFEYKAPAGQVSREAVRYLYFPGDLISPERKRQKAERYAIGGEEVDTMCLVRTQGFLPKGHITPLEKGYRWEPRDLLPPGVKGEIQSGANAQAKFGRWSEGLEGMPIYPGDECLNIISRSMDESGGPKGIVEISELAGHPFDAEIRGLTKLFLPDGKIPKTLSGIRRGIDQGVKLSNDSINTSIGGKMHRACDLFGYWAQAKIDIENELLKVGTVKGDNGSWTYTYTSGTLLLLEQMEQPRQDHALKDLASFNANLSEAVISNLRQDGRSEFDMEKLASVLQANQSSIAEQVASAVAKALAPLIDRQGGQRKP